MWSRVRYIPISLFEGDSLFDMYIYINNSLKIHEQNTKKITAVSVVLYVVSSDFLSLDNVDFENYFANKLINIGFYLSHLKHLYTGP